MLRASIQVLAQVQVSKPRPEEPEPLNLKLIFNSKKYALISWKALNESTKAKKLEGDLITAGHEIVISDIFEAA